MWIEVLDRVDGAQLDTAWKVYCDAFEELRFTAVQRHVMYRGEFDEVMADPRVSKHLAFDDAGDLHGLSTFTNDLDAVPLISPDYFRHRFPTHYEARQIWYVGFVAVHRAGRQARVFERLIVSMRETGAGELAMVALDVCRINDERFKLPQMVQIIMHRRFGDVRGARVDEQSYWLYEFPIARSTA